MSSYYTISEAVLVLLVDNFCYLIKLFITSIRVVVGSGGGH